jgi:hypothetical protein
MLVGPTTGGTFTPFDRPDDLITQVTFCRILDDGTTTTTTGTTAGTTTGTTTTGTTTGGTTTTEGTTTSPQDDVIDDTIPDGKNSPIRVAAPC